jgi:hypothetical protein
MAKTTEIATIAPIMQRTGKCDLISFLAALSCLRTGATTHTGMPITAFMFALVDDLVVALKQIHTCSKASNGVTGLSDRPRFRYRMRAPIGQRMLTGSPFDTTEFQPDLQ